jgi:Domain of unknown function (DUF4124)
MSQSMCDSRSRCGAWGVGLALCVALCLLSPTGAAAEIFECKGADGKTLFTSDRSACPGARPRELKLEMQSVKPPSAVSRAPAARATRPARRASSAGAAASGAGSGVPDGMIAMWRRKRPEAVAKLALLKDRAEYIHGVVGGCNRGATWYAKDSAGLKQYVSCEEIEKSQKEVEKEIAELEAYLAGGLEEECRRAGCLPGWIR